MTSVMLMFADMDELEVTLNTKANQVDVDASLSLKANQVDTDLALRA